MKATLQLTLEFEIDGTSVGQGNYENIEIERVYYPFRTTLWDARAGRYKGVFSRVKVDLNKATLDDLCVALNNQTPLYEQACDALDNGDNSNG